MYSIEGNNHCTLEGNVIDVEGNTINVLNQHARHTINVLNPGTQSMYSISTLPGAPHTCGVVQKASVVWC